MQQELDSLGSQIASRKKARDSRLDPDIEDLTLYEAMSKYMLDNCHKFGSKP